MLAPERRLDWAIRFLRIVLIGVGLLMSVLATLSLPGQLRAGGAITATDLLLLLIAETVVWSVFVAAVGIWRVLDLVQRGQGISSASARALTWVLRPALVVAGALAAAVVLVAIVGDDPGPVMLMMTFFLVSATLTLSTYVLRETIRAALA